jgi:hypothetical protein
MSSSRSNTSTTSASSRPSLFKAKSRRSRSQSQSHSSRNVTASEECPTTPLSLPPTTVQQSPSKKASSKKEKEVTFSTKNDKEVKVLTVMVQALAEKLKKREKQVLKLKERSNKLDEVSLLLERAEERIVDAAAENQALNRKVRCLQSTINLQDVEENTRWNQRDDQAKTTADTAAASAATAANTKRTNTEEFHQIVLARDMALLRAGEMSIDLAESRAETDELRDELAAITNVLRAQKSAAAAGDEVPSSSAAHSVVSTATPASPTSVAMPEFPIRSLQDSMKDLTNLAWDSGSKWVSKSRSPSVCEPEHA